MSNIGISPKDDGTAVYTKSSLFTASGNILREIQGVTIERPKPVVKGFNDPYRSIEDPPETEMLGLTALASASPLLIDVSQYSLLTISSFVVGGDAVFLAGIGYIPEDATKANWLPVAYLPLDILRTSYFTNKDTLYAMFSVGGITITDEASAIWKINPRIFTMDVSYLDKVAVFIQRRLSVSCTKVKICYALS